MRSISYPTGNWKIARITEPNGLLKYIDFQLLRLKKGEKMDFSSEDKECGFVLLSGFLKVEHNGEIHDFGPRRSVFESKAHALYLPREDTISLRAVYESEVAVACAPASEKHRFSLVKPGDVRVRIVGQLNWRRHVHDVITQNVVADRLLIGETFNPPGNWSSYPPHKHDVHDPPFESDMEEIYHFRVNPPEGFGAQFLYTDDGSLDEIIKIKNGLTVIIDRGYHPVVAAPGYQIYYLWVLAGEERMLIARDDPKHSWIKSMEACVRDW